MSDDVEVSGVNRKIELVRQDPAALFALLADGPDASTATERIASHYGFTPQMARIVLDQQLITMLAPG